MPEWRVETDTLIELDEPVSTARISLVGGTVDVVTTDGPPRVEITGVVGLPVVVRVDGGTLQVGYDDVGWNRILGWLDKRRREARVSLALPEGTRVQLGVVSAGSTVAGFSGAAEVRSVSSTVVLADLAGGVTGETVSGDLELRAVRGDVRLHSVSGSLTVVAGAPTHLQATTVSGDITLDLLPAEGGASDVEAGTVSGDVLVRAPVATLGAVRVTSTSGRIESPDGCLDVQRSPGRAQARWDGAGRTSFTGTTVSGRVVLLDRPATP